MLDELQVHLDMRRSRYEEIAALRGRLPPEREDEQRQRLSADADWLRRQSLAALAELVQFPPHHRRHEELLEEFWQGGSYDRSVFIMTKFPAAGPARTQRDDELDAVIRAVADAVEAAGCVPRIATRRRHDLLWDNVELYLLGCLRGIAVVEDKYLPELNPNVAMEWGWMRGMGKRVLYLAEQDFDRERADLSGLLKDQFSWTDPGPGIRQVVATFLQETA